MSVFINAAECRPGDRGTHHDGIRAEAVRDAASTIPEDLDDPRRVGWSDEDILSLTRAAAARSFVSKVFDALGADPDASYQDLDEETHHALQGKRPFA